jgi:hypothetical protein
MGDSAGTGSGVGNREISRQPEAIEPHPFTASASRSGFGSESGLGLALEPESASGSASGSVYAPQAQPPSGRKAPQRIPRWLQRGELFLSVMLRMYIGLAVCYAPWSHVFWDRNPLFAQFPTLAIYAANGAVRGIISGLGLLNLWIAFQEAIRHGDK